MGTDFEPFQNVEILDPGVLHSGVLSADEKVALKRKLKKAEAVEKYWERRRKRDKDLLDVPILGKQGFMLANRGFIAAPGQVRPENIRQQGNGWRLSLNQNTTEGDLDEFQKMLELERINLVNRPPSQNFLIDDEFLTQQAWYFRSSSTRLRLADAVGIDYDRKSGLPVALFFRRNVMPSEVIRNKYIYPKIL